MTLPATDTFTTGADAALTTYSANWSAVNNAFQVLAASDDVRPNAFAECAARWNADTFNNDQYAQIVISTVADADYIGPAVRCASGAATYYGYYGNNTNSYLFKVVAGTYTQIGSTGGAVAVNDLLYLEIQGSSLLAKKNGVAQFGGAQDVSADGITSGSAGIAGYGADNRVRGDNWEGGNLAAPATLTQVATRARNDDGSESAATTIADGNFTAPLATTVRVRFQIDTTGDAAATTYQLEAQRQGDGAWTKV